MEAFLNFVINVIGSQVGAILMITFGFAAIYCLKVWLVLLSYRASLFWAIAVFLVPFVDLVYTLKNWHLAKKPFLLGIFFLVLSIGMYLVRSLLQTFFNTQSV